MAVIYLRHPKHGAKVAISDMEAENDMQNGWEEYDPADLVSEQKAAAEIAPVTSEPAAESPTEPVNELQPRRRGRRIRETTE